MEEERTCDQEHQKNQNEMRGTFVVAAFSHPVTLPHCMPLILTDIALSYLGWSQTLTNNSLLSFVLAFARQCDIGEAYLQPDSLFGCCFLGYVFNQCLDTPILTHR